MSKIQMGKVSISSGQTNVNVGGQDYDYKNVPSTPGINDGESVVMLMRDDNTPVIIGRMGYSASY